MSLLHPDEYRTKTDTGAEVVFLNQRFPLSELIWKTAILAVGYKTQSFIPYVAWIDNHGYECISYCHKNRWFNAEIKDLRMLSEVADGQLFEAYQIERQKLVHAAKIRARYATDFASHSACGSLSIGWWL